MIRAIPPTWEQPSKLNILTPRNKPPQLDKAGIRDCLQKSQVTIKSDPTEFADYLQYLEDSIGTCYTTLAGLVMASENNPSTRHIVETVERFDQIIETLSEEVELSFSTYAEITEVHDFLSLEDIMHYTSNNNMPSALRRFQENLSEPDEPAGVGTCAICSPIFSSLALAKGFVAGEGRRFDMIHNVTWLPDNTIYELNMEGYSTLEQIAELDKYSFNHALAFVATLLTSQAYLLMRYINIHSPSSALLRETAHKLEIAEVINPYNTRTYQLKSDIYEELGENESARQNWVYYRNLEELLKRYPLAEAIARHAK